MFLPSCFNPFSRFRLCSRHRLETGNSYKHRLETGANSGTKCQPFELIEQIEPLKPCSSHGLETGANIGTKTQRLKPIKRLKRFKPLLNRHIKIPQRIIQTGF